jgi:gluconate 5-dehydrogenase
MERLDALFSIKGKVALVTGSYRGLGRQIAAGLAAAGATVVINGRSAEGVEEAVGEFRQAGVDAHGAVFDITDEGAVAAGIARVCEACGPVEILVNNAGIQRRGKLEEMPLADFREVIEANITSAFIVSKELVGGMIRRSEGKIINICSLMSDLARPTTGNYAAAKGGLRMLTRAMAAEWGRHNIQVNGIAPGYFATEMTRKLKDDPAFNDWICGRTPAGRWGDPQELQGLAIFLASGASSYVNGQVIFVDGGLTAVI